MKAVSLAFLRATSGVECDESCSYVPQLPLTDDLQCCPEKFVAISDSLGKKGAGRKWNACCRGCGGWSTRRINNVKAKDLASKAVADDGRRES